MVSGCCPAPRPSSFSPRQQCGPRLTASLRESNSHSFALTPHPCTTNTYHVCEDTTCGGTYSEDRFAGKCDANGCDYNPYRMGQKDFYGKGKTVDTSKKFTYARTPPPHFFLR